MKLGLDKRQLSWSLNLNQCSVGKSNKIDTADLPTLRN